MRYAGPWRRRRTGGLDVELPAVGELLRPQDSGGHLGNLALGGGASTGVAGDLNA
jgi:hypothetical protein